MCRAGERLSPRRLAGAFTLPGTQVLARLSLAGDIVPSNAWIGLALLMIVQPDDINSTIGEQAIACVRLEMDTVVINKDDSGSWSSESQLCNTGNGGRDV